MSDSTASIGEKKPLSAEEKEELGSRLKAKFRLAVLDGDDSYLQEIEDVVEAAGNDAVEIAEEYIFAYAVQNWLYRSPFEDDIVDYLSRSKNLRNLFEKGRPSDVVRGHLSLAAKNYLGKLIAL